MICSKLVMDLGNPFEVVVHHLLIGGMPSLDHWDQIPMVGCGSVYGYTLDMTYSESWYEIIR